MSVMSVSDVYSQASTSTSTKDETVMGKDDFLALLVAQLQNQDPLNPSDSTEFTAQLAQFSSLEQLQNINEELSGFEVYQSTLNNIQTSGFIGKTITATGDTLTVEDGIATDIAFSLDDSSASVYIQIYDASGTFVADIDAGSLSAGQQTVSWDATDDNGMAVGDGVYTYSIMAVDSDGNSVDTTSFISGKVTGIDYESGETLLLIGDQKVSISSMIRVEENETGDNS
ncbi:Flagellar basal body rod modification protein [Desulfosarcina cetonica]|uniref:flagellar hook assembly protein FlgD n=1 Tax=Desulfosarcina cetonica TaxID=90730 RepID=UPI0009F82FA3|nr:flagellar hook assembly protein FlgD [Desulfosarcina cetonica]VTR65270.1 Flagellar basal body rod modification protein [Desulfosarcina cetonica]